MHSVGELLPNEEDWKDMENKDWEDGSGGKAMSTGPECGFPAPT